MKLKKYQLYIFNLFIKKFLIVSFIFFCTVVIINFFEEIKFSEKYNTEIYYSVYLSLMNAPSLMFEILPFIFLICVKFFYIDLIDKDEMAILNSNGISNFNIVNSRIENLEFLDPSLIVSRALTSTKNLLFFSVDHMLKSKKINSNKEAIKNLPNLLFLKGKTFKEELNDIPENLKIKFQTFPSITSAESRILLYSKNIL